MSEVQSSARISYASQFAKDREPNASGIANMDTLAILTAQEIGSSSRLTVNDILGVMESYGSLHPDRAPWPSNTDEIDEYIELFKKALIRKSDTEKQGEK